MSAALDTPGRAGFCARQTWVTISSENAAVVFIASSSLRLEAAARVPANMTTEVGSDGLAPSGAGKTELGRGSLGFMFAGRERDPSATNCPAAFPTSPGRLAPQRRRGFP